MESLSSVVAKIAKPRIFPTTSVAVFSGILKCLYTLMMMIPLHTCPEE